MDIAYLSPYVYPFMKGGSEKRIHEIGSRLAARGHDVTVYSRNWWDGAAERTHEGMTLRSIGPKRELYADGDRRSVPSALEFATRSLSTVRHSHDVLITSVAPYFHVLTARLTSALRSTPLVVTWHEVWNDYWYDYMGRPGAIGKLVEGIVSNVPCYPVAPSNMMADKLLELSTINRDVDVIPNGIDTDVVEATDPVDDGFDVLYAGRLIEDKNVDLLLDAFEQTETSTSLGIIGDGPQYDELREHAATLDCADQVEFLGFLEEYEDVLAHMRAADVFASPSIREGFGITFVEAMAADCTVVTVEHPYSAGSEVVDGGGFVVEPTVDDVANALTKALSGERPPIAPVERAQKYDWDEIADQMEDLLEQIVGA